MDNGETKIEDFNIVALAGGVGGAKLADGLAQIVPPDRLTIIGNTGDDFRHLGLMVCPDLDTVMYNLAGVDNPETGWGRDGESWRTMREAARLGGPDWFQLGDLDLATHLIRSQFLSEGRTLTEATQHLCGRFGLTIKLLPMSDQLAPTLISTDEGVLSFQTWFVARRWQPRVREVLLPDDVRATSQVLTALEDADVVIIAPSNPFVSIDPILNVYPIRSMISDLPELVMAVSPIVAGQAVKGPAAEMMAEMGMEVSASAVAGYYDELVDAFVYDCRETELSYHSGQVALQTDTIMSNRADRRRLAQDVLNFATELLAS